MTNNAILGNKDYTLKKHYAIMDQLLFHDSITSEIVLEMQNDLSENEMYCILHDQEYRDTLISILNELRHTKNWYKLTYQIEIREIIDFFYSTKTLIEKIRKIFIVIKEKINEFIKR